jgi:hypothetical protein
MTVDTARSGDMADAAVGDGGVDALTMDGAIITMGGSATPIGAANSPCSSRKHHRGPASAR